MASMHPNLQQLEQHQGTAVARLRRAIARGRLPHALILASPGNVGENDLAALAAQHLLCTQPAGPLAPCGACASCHMVAAGTHPELHQVRPKGLLRAIKTEDMLELIQALQQTSLTGGAKVAVIFQAESLRKESANRFLKTLEEPTPDTYFILVTTRIERLLPTIRSRCQTIRLQPLSTATLRARASTELGVTGNQLDLVTAVARGRWNRAEVLAARLDEYCGDLREIAGILGGRDTAASAAVGFGSRKSRELKIQREEFDARCKDDLAAKSRELADVEPAVRREVLDALEEDLKSAQAASERDAKASLFEALADLWRDVWVFKLTRETRLLLHPFLQQQIATLAGACSEHQIVRNLADIDLVRGPTVYLNARIDYVLQGLLAQATTPLQAHVPLRRAIMATGL